MFQHKKRIIATFRYHKYMMLFFFILFQRQFFVVVAQLFFQTVSKLKSFSLLPKHVLRASLVDQTKRRRTQKQ